MEDIKKNDIIDEIIAYNPYSEKITLSTLLMLNQGVHVLNLGESGIGKSRGSTELLDLIKIPFYQIASHITPKAFFEILQKDSHIVVDEGAILLSNKVILNLLLNALWSGKIEWKSGREYITHNFKGTIIFNTNRLTRSSFIRALIDRIHNNHVVITSKQFIEKIESRNIYKPKMEIWAEIKDRLSTRFPITNTIKKRLMVLIENTEVKSVREMWKLEKIASFSLSLVGDLSLIKYFNNIDEVWDVLNNDELSRPGKVREIMKIRCVTERQASRILNKYEVDDDR